MKKLIKTFLLFHIFFYSFSQNKNVAFTTVDSKILNLPAYNSGNLDSLSQLLTKDFSAQAEKVRAIYVWVANNISYDTQKYFSGRKKISALSGYEATEEAADNIIRSRKAVCEGYSNLVKALCIRAGIQCEVIEGIGRPHNEDDLHAWNIINIDGEWKLLDVTWSAGAVDMKNKKYYKNFTDKFFLSDPGEYIKSHYPFDPIWQLLLHPVNRIEYEARKTISGDTTVFNFNDSIYIYLRQDSISQLINASRRAYKYDPENKLAKQNFEMAKNYAASEKMRLASLAFHSGVNNYNECIDIINKARMKQNTKLMNANEAKLNQLVKNCRDSTEKALEIYRSVEFTDNTNSQILNYNIENGLKNLRDLESIENYLKKYFSTPKLGRLFVL